MHDRWTHLELDNSKFRMKPRPRTYTKRISSTQGRRDFVAGALGRPLNHDEHVHHMDLNHGNDSLDNLTVLSADEHKGAHSKYVARLGGSPAYPSVADEIMRIVALDITR
jgi:hypothetical protein